MSTLQAVYDRFVAQPTLNELYEDATLSYISSGTNVVGAENIVKSILRARHDVEINEKVLAYHLGHSSLTVECAAECKFKEGPSWIAPGVDENLIDGKVAQIALVKTVVFNSGKIKSIRVYWDQATVLKQLDIVGAHGRGWPITDGMSQINLVVNTVVPGDSPMPEQVAAPVVADPEPVVPAVNVTAPEKNAAARRTYSISNDIGPDVNEHHRLPRIGWQNNRQDFLVSDEGNISVKEQSPVRLPRTGQAPRREFSFSNLSAVYNAQEQPLPNKSREPTHFEFGDGTDEPPAAVKPKGGATSGYYHDLYAAGEEKEKPKSTARSGQGAHDGHFEFGDAGEETPRPTSSKGGGTGGYYHDLYDAAEEKAPAKSTARGSHARHDSHFEFGDDTYESVPAKSTARSSHGKHDSHFEFDDGANDVAAPIKPSKGGGTGGYYHDLYEPLDENSKPKSTARSGQGAHARGLQHETIFLDNADFTSKPPTKKSIGGGTGGRRPEETIFVEQDDHPLPTKKNPVIRRDQQHFQFGPDSIPSTPVQATRRVINDKQFSIESTPDPRDEEYRARALQKKQVNHFRPDTIPNFSFADASPAETGKKENTEGMNKLLKGMGRSWTMGADSPSVSKESQRVGIPQKGLTPHFSFGGDSPAEEEKENGRANTKRMHVPVVTEEKEWWET